jgi:hypothetical protein
MKSVVVPAQITTVEDKIVGSLSFSQIILLVFSLIVGTAFYGLIAPKLHLSTFKAILMILQFMFFGGLALRYQGRILADWLILYLRFKSRPRVYTFTKNDLPSRMQPEAIKELVEKPVRHVVQKTKKIKNKKTAPTPLIENAGSIISIKPSKKGGLDVEYFEA